MKIDCAKVDGIAESIVASGLPMLAEYDEEQFSRDCASVAFLARLTDREPPQFDNDRARRHLDRAYRLSSAPVGSGHCTFLAGVLVSANITASQVWWLQFGRYHHQQIVSSQSKMHRIRRMVEANGLGQFGIGSSDELREMTDEDLAMRCPMGLPLTARVTTNYLQLRTIYQQRKGHKLSEWNTFRSWVEGLPLSNLITCE